MLLNKANDENMLRHIFIDLDNYKYHAQPCIIHRGIIIGLGAISRKEFIDTKHLQTMSSNRNFSVFNEKGYGFFIDKFKVRKDLSQKNTNIIKAIFGNKDILQRIEELENYLFSEMLNIVTENTGKCIKDKKEQK